MCDCAPSVPAMTMAMTIPAAVVPPSVSGPALVRTPAVVVAAMVSVTMSAVIAKSKVERDGRADVGRVAIGGIRIIGSIGWAVDGASSETGMQQQDDGKAPYCEHASNVHGSLR